MASRREAEEPASWLAALNEPDLMLFLAEMRQALEVAETTWNTGPLETCLREWRATGEALADPAVREILTGDGGEPGDYGEVQRPG